MDYEQAIDNIGGCGFYQKFMLSFLYSCTILDGLQIGSMIFIAPTLKHRCAIPGYPNDTYEVHSDSHEEMINRYIPSRTTEGEINYYGCSIYANETTNGNFTKRSCHSWVYDKTNTHNSITSQLDLVCDKSNLGNHTITFFFLGYLFAMVVTGILSDRFGRKKVIIISLFLQGSSGICTALISNIYGIYILRFLTAVGGAGSYIPSVVFAHRWILTLTSIISRLFITAAFGIIYLFTLELYPTCIRNGALGAMSTWARLGGSLAPYTVNLTSGMSNKLGMIIPMIIMGVLSIFSGLISFILPETNNRKMMDDFSDISKSGKLERAVKKEENKEETVPMTGLKPQQDDEC
ncbi:cation transportertransporter-like-like [Argonauta hians]